MTIARTTVGIYRRCGRDDDHSDTVYENGEEIDRDIPWEEK